MTAKIASNRNQAREGLSRRIANAMPLAGQIASMTPLVDGTRNVTAMAARYAKLARVQPFHVGAGVDVVHEPEAAGTR